MIRGSPGIPGRWPGAGSLAGQCGTLPGQAECAASWSVLPVLARCRRGAGHHKLEFDVTRITRHAADLWQFGVTWSPAAVSDSD